MPSVTRDWPDRLVITVTERVPVVVMCYATPILIRGAERFVGRLREAGISGLIVPDLPLEESAELRGLCDASGIALVPLATPTTPVQRLARIGGEARGFIYTVSHKPPNRLQPPSRATRRWWFPPAKPDLPP